MRLIGAKKFLETVKPGTLYKRFWLHSTEECLDLIKRYESKQDLYYYSELEIFLDNSGSLGFLNTDNYEEIIINDKTYSCLFYYDSNVVGDASPTTTLYLVYDNEDEWPAIIKVENIENELLTKEDLINIRDWFLHSEVFDEERNVLALDKLNTDDYYKNNYIVNY